MAITATQPNAIEFAARVVKSKRLKKGTSGLNHIRNMNGIAIKRKVRINRHMGQGRALGCGIDQFLGRDS